MAVLAAPIARSMGPTWDPSGADITQTGPMLVPWILLFGRWNNCDCRDTYLAHLLHAYLHHHFVPITYDQCMSISFVTIGTRANDAIASKYHYIYACQTQLPSGDCAFMTTIDVYLCCRCRWRSTLCTCNDQRCLQFEPFTIHLK